MPVHPKAGGSLYFLARLLDGYYLLGRDFRDDFLSTCRATV